MSLVRAKKLSNLITSAPKSNPQYELNISELKFSLLDDPEINESLSHEDCTSLPLDREGLPPTTVIRVRSYRNHGDQQAWATIGHTEIIQVHNVHIPCGHMLLSSTSTSKDL